MLIKKVILNKFMFLVEDLTNFSFKREYLIEN
jgi:hypothetical protein